MKEASRATTAVGVSLGLGSMARPRIALPAAAAPRASSRISYFCNGEIHVNEVGQASTGIANVIGMQIDLSRIKETRPKVAQMLRDSAKER